MKPVTTQVKCKGCHVITAHIAILNRTVVTTNSSWTGMYNITHKYQEYLFTLYNFLKDYRICYVICTPFAQ